MPTQSVIFLPGLLCDRSYWERQIVGLSDTASCTSAEWHDEDSLPAMAQTVLASAPDRFAVAGHSMGGRVALEVYRAAPDRVTHIALLNTGYQARPAGAAGEDEARGRYALLEIARTKGMRAMAEQWLPPMIHPDRRNDPAITNAVYEMFCRKTPEIYAAQIQALLSRPDATSVLEQIRCPALVLTGREDAWSPPARHAEIAEKIPGSRLLVIPHCGHMSTLEEPDAVTEALRGWLAA